MLKNNGIGINYQRILHRSEGAKNNGNVAADAGSVDTSFLWHAGLAQPGKDGRLE